MKYSHDVTHDIGSRRRDDVVHHWTRRQDDVIGSWQKESYTTLKNDVYRLFPWCRPDVEATPNYLEGTAEASKLTFSQNTSKDADPCKDVLFGGFQNKN